MFRRAQLVFLNADALETLIADVSPVLVVERLDTNHAVPTAAKTVGKSSGSAPASATAPTQAGSSSAVALSSLSRSQTAFQPSQREVVPATSSSSSIAVSKPAKGAGLVKRKTLARVDENVEMVEPAHGASPETQQISAPKAKKSRSSLGTTSTAVKTAVRRPSASPTSSQTRTVTNSASRPARRAGPSTNGHSSSSISSPSPTPAGLKKRVRRPGAPSLDSRAPSATAPRPPALPGPPAPPAVAPVTPIGSSTNHFAPPTMSAPPRPDFLATSSSPRSGRHHRALGDPLFVDSQTLVPAPADAAPSYLDQLRGLSIQPQLASSTAVALVDSPAAVVGKLISPFVSPTNSQPMQAIVVPQPNSMMVVDNPAGSSKDRDTGKAVDPSERGGGGEGRVGEDVEMDLNEMDDDALTRVVENVMADKSFPDLVRRIGAMGIITEE